MGKDFPQVQYRIRSHGTASRMYEHVGRAGFRLKYPTTSSPSPLICSSHRSLPYAPNVAGTPRQRSSEGNGECSSVRKAAKPSSSPQQGVKREMRVG